MSLFDTKGIVYLVAAALIAGAAVWFIHSQRQAGYAEAVADVAAGDKGALDAVETARTDLATCRARRADGWVWDRAEGTCVRSGGVSTVPGAGGGSSGR